VMHRRARRGGQGNQKSSNSPQQGVGREAGEFHRQGQLYGPAQRQHRLPRYEWRVARSELRRMLIPCWWGEASVADVRHGDYTSGGICHTRGEVIPGVNPVKGAMSGAVSGKFLRLDWAQLHELRNTAVLNVPVT
jgi:hypothetical protein